MRASASPEPESGHIFASCSLLLVFCVALANVSPAQTLTTLHNFAGPPNDGAAPSAGLIQATDGNFYGTTTGGGANDDGTVFKITPAGPFTMLHSFATATTACPRAG